jgi:hypothetical protein
LDDSDIIAEKLVTGEINCTTCPELNEYVSQVRNGEMSFDDFKDIVRANKDEKLKGLV